MRLILPVLMCIAPALSGAEEAPAGKIPAIDLLPAGSVLEGVMLPRYDENRKLTGVLNARIMTLENSEQVEGQDVSLEFFKPDATRRGKIDLKRATFNQPTGAIVAREPVEIVFDRFTAAGTGLHYNLESGKGYLLGPATTRIINPPQTSMNPPAVSPFRAAAIFGTSLLAMPLIAAPPPPVSAEEHAKINADAADKASEAIAANEATRATLDADLKDADEAGKAAAAFMKDSGIPTANAEAVADAKPLEVKPGAGDTIVNSDNGFYIDMEGGVMVYRKNVRVSDPRFNLTGANELKIFFDKKPVKEPAKEAPKEKPAEDPEKPVEKKVPEKEKEAKEPGGMGAGFGDVDRIVATGAVRILQKSIDGKDPIEASGALLVYHVKTGEIIISGGYPWFTQGPSTFLRAKEPQLTLRLLKDGSANTEGHWEMGIPLEQKR